MSDYKSVLVVTGEKNNRTELKQYFIKVIKETNNILIGIPTDREYSRIRVDIPDDTAKFYIENSNGNIKERKLSRINNRAPTWVHDFFTK